MTWVCRRSRILECGFVIDYDFNFAEERLLSNLGDPHVEFGPFVAANPITLLNNISR
jgi:hypothetical protein